MEEEIKKEDDQKKLVNITTVPSTGEQVILNDYDANNHRSFEDIVKMINNGEEVLNTTVLTKSEMKKVPLLKMKISKKLLRLQI